MLAIHRQTEQSSTEAMEWLGQKISEHGFGGDMLENDFAGVHAIFGPKEADSDVTSLRRGTATIMNHRNST